MSRRYVLTKKVKAPDYVRSVCHGGCGEIVQRNTDGWHHILFLPRKGYRVNTILDAAHTPDPVVTDA